MEEELNIDEPSEQGEAKKGEPVFTSYILEPLYSGWLNLCRPEGTEYFVIVDLRPDSGVKRVKTETTFEGLNPSENRIVEASLKAADSYLTDGHLRDLRAYYQSWREIKAADQVTDQLAYYDPTVLEGGGEVGLRVEPELKEYLVFQDDRALDEIKRDLLGESLEAWLQTFREKFEKSEPFFFNYFVFTSFGGYKYKKGSDGELRQTKRVREGRRPPVEVEDKPITWDTFEETARKFVFAELST
ncbi:MAG TPA: hypothetical protein VMW41_05770 [Candidatus Bathyarchaeia archaeon]|nr:hypothetical protein [Candidatus Bathyarchaeia archaeon]